MFIQTEETPNPRTLKFIPGETVMAEGTITFVDKEDAKKSPLANALFKIEQVEGVFFGSDFVSVTKDEKTHWDVLKPAILTTIMEHFISGLPLLREEKNKNSNEGDKQSYTKEEAGIVNEVKELIETKIRPAVAQDGGDIIFKKYKEGVVFLEMHGACAGCPSSTVTLKNGIENMLKHYIPEIEAVEAVNEYMDL